MIWYAASRLRQLEQPEHGPPIPPRADGGQPRIEVRVRQLGTPRAVGALQVDLPAAHGKGIRWRAERVERSHAPGIGLSRQEQNVEPVLGRTRLQKRVVANRLAQVRSRP